MTIRRLSKLAIAGQVVRVTTTDNDVGQYLARFYPRASKVREPQWTVHVHSTGSTHGLQAGVPKTLVGHLKWQSAELVHVTSHRSSIDAAVLAATAIRGGWVSRTCAEGRLVSVLHAACISKADQHLALVGHSKSGKTTLMLDGVLNEGWTFVGNDVLVFEVSPNSPTDVIATGAPALIKVRPEAMRRFRLSPSLAWPTEEVVDGLYFMPEMLGKCRPTIDWSTGTDPIVLVCAFGNETVVTPVDAMPPDEVLADYVRRDWLDAALKHGFVGGVLDVPWRSFPKCRVYRAAHDGRLRPILERIARCT